MLLLRRIRSRIRFPHFRSRPRRSRPKSNGVTLFVVLVLILTIFAILYSRLTPIVSEMAVAGAKNTVTNAINSAVNARMAAGEMNYKDIVRLEKDETGKVTALITDMSRINALKSEISYDIIKMITDDRITRVSIPVGNLIGGSLFSGMGPNIPVKIVAASAVSTNFSNQFSSSGINQTRHQIVVKVGVAIKVLIPGKTVKTEVETELTVAETIIVGSVPDSFTYFEESEKWDTGTEKYDIMS
ncbi:MAG: sporulation protein YunB [Clostridiales bacterium]|jgi:sporulation protein YunB|nr:sporulation protein YunB [Clostridiales bacterium]